MATALATVSMGTLPLHWYQFVIVLFSSHETNGGTVRPPANGHVSAPTLTVLCGAFISWTGACRFCVLHVGAVPAAANVPARAPQITLPPSSMPPRAAQVAANCGASGYQRTSADGRTNNWTPCKLDDQRVQRPESLPSGKNFHTRAACNNDKAACKKLHVAVVDSSSRRL